jgi:hypothetical protein
LTQAKERKKAANRAAKEENKKKSRKATKNAHDEKKVTGRSDIAAKASLAANDGPGASKEKKPAIQLGGLRGLEGIAAAAAAAARLKSDKSGPVFDSMIPPPTPGDLVKKSVVALSPGPVASAGGIAAAAAEAAIQKAKKQKDASEADFAASRSEGIGALASQAASRKFSLSTSKLSTGDMSQKDSSHQRDIAANLYLQGRSEHDVYDDRGEPLNLDKANPNRSRSSDAPEYASAATQFQRRSNENRVYDEHGEPVILNDKVTRIQVIPAQLQGRTSREKAYDENGEPLDLAELTEKEERTRKSAFAAKAAAYRRRKGNKDEKEASHDDEEGTKVGSSLSPSRKDSKAQGNLNDVPKESVRDLNSMPGAESESEIGKSKGLIAAAPSLEETESWFPEKQERTGEDAPRKPVCDEGLLAIFLERDQEQRERPESRTKVEPPSLESFFERQVSHEIRSELLRQNFDDSSVAIMADRLEKKAIDDSKYGDPAKWNEGGGISDFIGWANQAIQASDTESVRGFEISRNLDDQHDYDDDSTIATYYDDDASIVSSSTMTPMQRDGQYVSFGQFGDFGQGSTGHSYEHGIELPYDTRNDGQYETQFDDQYGGQYDDNVPSVTAKVAASILFNDSETDSSVDQSHAHPGGVRPNALSGRDSELIDMALTFNDVGLDAGLSFGADVGFDDGLGFGGVEDSLGGFGVSASHVHGMPTNSLSYGDHFGVDSFDGPGTSGNLSNSPRGDDGGMSDKRRSGSKWFQWGKGK